MYTDATSQSPNLKIGNTPDEVAYLVLERFVSYARTAIESRGRFAVALSGGKTPEVFYRLLVSSKESRALDWSSIHIFLADERCVAADSSESNYCMITSLLKPLTIPPQNLHPMYFGNSAEESSEQASHDLQEFFDDSIPQFDLVLLGIGEDGHTASLFPDHTENLNSDKAVVAVHDAPKEPPDRISLTPPAINNADHIIFLVTGNAKSSIIRELFSTPIPHLPATFIFPTHGDVEWLLDAEAASKLG